MHSYQEWKNQVIAKQLSEAADLDIAAIKAVFDNLRQTIARSSESAGVMGTLKRGLFGAAKGAAKLFGGSKLLRGEATEAQENLFLEWDKNALDVIMKAVDDAEQQIMHKLSAMKSMPGAAASGPNSFDTDMPYALNQITLRYPTHKAFKRFTDKFQTELPPTTIEKMEKKFETDPVLNKVIDILSGNNRRHAMTALKQVAQEQGLTPEQLADTLDMKYQAQGKLKTLLLGKRPKGTIEQLGAYGDSITRPTGEKFPIGGSIDA